VIRKKSNLGWLAVLFLATALLLGACGDSTTTAVVTASVSSSNATGSTTTAVVDHAKCDSAWADFWKTYAKAYNLNPVEVDGFQTMEYKSLSGKGATYGLIDISSSCTVTKISNAAERKSGDDYKDVVWEWTELLNGESKSYWSRMAPPPPITPKP
jgi:hypothetical protein